MAIHLLVNDFPSLWSICNNQAKVEYSVFTFYVKIFFFYDIFDAMHSMDLEGKQGEFSAPSLHKSESMLCTLGKFATAKSIFLFQICK